MQHLDRIGPGRVVLGAALEHRPGLVPVDRNAQRLKLALVAGGEDFLADRRDLRRQRGKVARGRGDDVGVPGGLGHGPFP